MYMTVKERKYRCCVSRENEHLSWFMQIKDCTVNNV